VKMVKPPTGKKRKVNDSEEDILADTGMENGAQWEGAATTGI
jgi:hypothetical protein